MELILSFNFSIDACLLVVDEPLLLFFKCLLQHNVSLTIRINVFKEVDTSLVLSAPLLLA